MKLTRPMIHFFTVYLQFYFIYYDFKVAKPIGVRLLHDYHGKGG